MVRTKVSDFVFDKVILSVLKGMVWVQVVLADRLVLALKPYKARLGKLTLYAGIGMVLLGFPAQIYANWRAHECEIDPVLIGVALALYVVRIPYTISLRAWPLLPADVLGLLLSVVLVWQYFSY